MRKSIRASLCAVLVGLLAACGGGGGSGGALPPLGNLAASPSPTAPSETPGASGAPEVPTDPAAPTIRPAVVEGKVSVSGTPVPNATVRIGAQFTTTDAQGRYRIEIAEPTASAIVLVKSAGHLTMAKQAALAPGQASTQDIELQAVDVQRTFYAADGVIAIVNGAVIDIPKDAIKDASGAPYNGQVRLVASYRNPTTAAGVDAFPQPYQGDAGGTPVNLQTLGVIEATLATPAGQPLQLRAPAILVYPGVSVIDRGAATIPLWHYDEARGIWVREGEAARQSDGSYLGKVSHFTAWNLDVEWGGAFTGITVNFCVKYTEGATTRHGIQVYLDGPGFSDFLKIDSLASGDHRFINVPAYTALTLRLVDSGNGSTQTQAIAATAPGGTVDLPSCASLVGTADYVAPPPPPPLTPVPADTPVNALVGLLTTSSIRWGSPTDNRSETGWINGLVANAAGAIGGSGGFNPSEEPMSNLSGQMAVGGYFNVTADRRVGGRTPQYGPMLFSGRVYVDPVNPVGRRGVMGVWSYANPPEGVTTPTGAQFASADLNF
ncbi:MAG: hypothetical protein EOO26_01555 [Comamonadaceae bacterium]|nr:MAG: hypothetical protein EOO26_01555 [Comamonadaceae bacterium]